MEGEKDSSVKGHSIIKDNGSVSMMGSFSYESVLVKTEKIAGAFYLLTNHIDVRESLRREMRDCALGLIKDIRAANSSSALNDKNAAMASFTASAGALISYLKLARLAGLISAENEMLLRRELEELMPLFDGSVLLEPSVLFPEGKAELQPAIAAPQDARPLAAPKAIHKRHFLIKDRPALPPRQRNGALHSGRRDKIVAFLRLKGPAGIKDIFDGFADVSEKTIQRELAKLVGEKVIVREGNKRWSRYAVAPAA